MQREKIYLQRIKRFSEMITKLKYFNNISLQAEFIYDKKNPIPYRKALQAKFKAITKGEEWGELWGSAWFRFKGHVPKEFAGKEVAALIDLNGEGCVWKDGTPWLGLTNKIHWDLRSGKYFVPLFKEAAGGEKVDLLVEAGANGLFGSGQNDYRLQQAEIVCVDVKARQLEFDLKVLLDLLEALEENSPRRNKLLFGLNTICNKWSDGRGVDKCLEISAELLSKPAQASSLTAYSIGHAHLDLAWLWPVRETRRKGGRTFATALQLLEDYPEYKFGASQPQLYEWIKTDYPRLYEKVKTAVKQGKWELQGAMWVEPDMNIPNGESLVRQCLFGKRFFQDEFGIEIDNLWLPDVFGYSAALPQILKKSGINYFMTQKISWNETNQFPHHTFIWKGIDGTSILTHFLPTNDYNLANLPSQLIASEKRYAQNDVSNEFLNLYGIGDGGGGPSREHIEMGLRQRDLEGVPKFKFSLARDFFKKIADIPREDLPVWCGELYLELHRGTYTTQALMKRHNRLLERKLHDIEFLGVMCGEFPAKDLEQIWKDTLLNQFHDILPGSSINWVYKDANALSANNILKLQEIQLKQLEKKFGTASRGTGKYVVINTQPWLRQEIVRIPASDGKHWIGDGISSSVVNSVNGAVDLHVTVPPLGYSCIQLGEEAPEFPAPDIGLKAAMDFLENELLRVELDENGAIASILDKIEEREILTGKANLLQLWEDEPNNWGAWDINHFYRETEPETAQRIAARVEKVTAHSVILEQDLVIGNSTITQKISLTSGSKLILIENHVKWQEIHKMLRVSAEVQIQSDNATYEIQFGSLKRPTHNNTTWDAAKFEMAGQRFADISQQDYGFAVLNDCKYGHYIKGNIVDLTLLRSPQDTDKEADQHEHDFVYAYYPHKHDLENSDVLQQAHNLNSPLILHEVEELPKEKSYGYFTTSDRSVKIDTVKLAESGEGVILRLYETMGKSTETKLTADRQWQEISETDLLENNPIPFNSQSESIDLLFEPFEIRTFLLKL